jgi:hypothetical protein
MRTEKVKENSAMDNNDDIKRTRKMHVVDIQTKYKKEGINKSITGIIV